MQTHTTMGAEIIGDHPSELLQMARVVALAHHEKWDGSGYPQRLAWQAIPREARVVAITDVFDALTSERPYKQAWSQAEAVDFMRAQSSKQFDPGLLSRFLELIPDEENIRRQYADIPD